MGAEVERGEGDLTVSDLKRAIEALPLSTEITFGSSRSSRLPLIFNRFKRRGDDLLQIELNELFDEEQANFEFSELDSRITVGELQKELSGWRDTDFVVFGSTIDAVELFSTGPKVVLSFELDQIADD